MTKIRKVAMACVALTIGCSSKEHDESQGSPEAGSDMGDGTSAPSRSNRLYVVNTDGMSLSVIDHEARQVVATVDIGNQPHGQAPASDGEFIYVTTDGGLGEIVAVRTSDNTVAWRLEVGEELNEPHLTRDDRFIYAPDLLAARVAVMDVTTGQLIDQIPMVDDAGDNLIGLHNTYASHDGEHMFVTAIFSQKIARIGAESREIDRVYSLSGEPRPAVITEDDTKMYVQLSALHGFIELDLDTGEETARIEWPEPAEPPAGQEEAEAILTKCHGIGITPDGEQLWAATNLEGAVYVYSLPDLEQTARFDVGNYPNWIAFSSDGTTGYVTNTDPLANHGTVSVVDVETHRVETTLDVGPAPKRIHRVELPAAAAP